MDRQGQTTPRPRPAVSLRLAVESAAQFCCFHSGQTTPQASAQNIVSSQIPPAQVSLYLRARGEGVRGARLAGRVHLSLSHRPTVVEVGGPRRATTGTEGRPCRGRGPLCTPATDPSTTPARQAQSNVSRNLSIHWLGLPPGLKHDSSACSWRRLLCFGTSSVLTLSSSCCACGRSWQVTEGRAREIKYMCEVAGDRRVRSRGVCGTTESAGGCAPRRNQR